MDGMKWNELTPTDKGRIRQEMVRNLVRTVKARFPHKSGRICYEVAISMVDKAIDAERAREN